MESYTLGLEGNRTATHVSSFHVTSTANRLIEDEQNTYEYDIDGNLIKKTIKVSGQQWRYQYSAYDHLIRAQLFASATASLPISDIKYAYDALNRRVKRDESGARRIVEHYFHDGWDIDSIDELTVPSGVFPQLTRRAWFTMGDTDDLYAMTLWNPATGGPGTASYYYSTDHLGSVRALTDDAGNVVADLDTDSFGKPLASVETVPQPFRFTGREYDRTTGLYHYRTREYDPASGRFLQEDSIFFILTCPPPAGRRRSQSISLHRLQSRELHRPQRHHCAG